VSHSLALYEDRLGPAATATFGALPRVLYVASGDLRVDDVRVDPAAAWHGAAACVVAAGTAGATVLRYELRGDGPPAPGPHGRLLLDHPIALDPGAPYLMRCDRVDFGPGGEALPHGHRGGGIRWLLEGSLDVRVGDHPSRLMKPGDAWFESGVEPVHAMAARDAATSFIRVSILPRELRGKSSIVYVDPAHASVKPRRYTVYIDEPIDLHGGPDMALKPPTLGSSRQGRDDPR
jgi:hypothetical protein